MATQTTAPDPETLEKPKRRYFTAAFKAKILDLTDPVSPEERAKLLRKYGLYSSHLTEWKRARDSVTLAAMAKKRGPKSKVDPQQEESARLARENAQLRRKLEVALDLFSRFVVGWMLAHTENGKLAARVLRDACLKQGVDQADLIIHADRGAAATSNTVADLLGTLGVRRSFSRPRVSDDNPHIEAHFKHLKYSPDFPSRFASFDDALTFCRHFFAWYNHQHRHSGLAFFTPAAVHHGEVDQLAARRNDVLRDAYSRFPERFAHGPPASPLPPAAVYINPPETPIADTNTLH